MGHARPDTLPRSAEWSRSDATPDAALIDPETYAYRGERSTVTRDASIDPMKAGNPAGRIEQGQTVVVERSEPRSGGQDGRRARSYGVVDGCGIFR